MIYLPRVILIRLFVGWHVGIDGLTATPSLELDEHRQRVVSYRDFQIFRDVQKKVDRNKAAISRKIYHASREVVGPYETTELANQRRHRSRGTTLIRKAYELDPNIVRRRSPPQPEVRILGKTLQSQIFQQEYLFTN